MGSAPRVVVRVLVETHQLVSRILVRTQGLVGQLDINGGVPFAPSTHLCVSGVRKRFVGRLTTSASPEGVAIRAEVVFLRIGVGTPQSFPWQWHHGFRRRRLISGILF